MRIALTLSAAMLALATSAPSASAQRSGGGTIGCDPGLPTFAVQASSCRIFFQESLYGPAANLLRCTMGTRLCRRPCRAAPDRCSPSQGS